MLRSIGRFFVIWHTLVKFGIDRLVPTGAGKIWVVNLLTYIMPVAWSRQLDQPPALRIRQVLEALGPIYVKLGQAISTRPDLLTKDIAEELSKLQDNVKPFAKAQAIEIIERAIGQSIDRAFAHFDHEVFASASIAQVHTATLNSGESVIVKVVRPNIRQTIRSDLGLMYLFARFAHAISYELRRLRLPEVINEFDKTIMNELDLLQEAANAATLKHHFKDSDMLYVPRIHWRFCTQNTLVMERVYGVPINDMETLNEHRVNLQKLANNGVTIFFTQVFYHQYFHADMHPGNIFVDINDPENPKYIAVDFGIMGSLNDQDQYYLAENFLAFFNRDYRRVAKLHIDSGWVPANVSITDFEAAIRKASEPIFEKPLKDISFARFLMTLFHTAQQFEMQVQPQLVLLQKTLFNIEGLGRVLYPDLDLWATGKPILEKWMKEQLGPIAFYKKLKSQAGEYTELLTGLPSIAKKTLRGIDHNKERQNQHLINAILLGAVLIALLQNQLWGLPWSRLVLVASAVFLSWRLFKPQQ